MLSIPQVDVSIPNDKLDLALHIFAENCAWPECTEIVEQLISNGTKKKNKEFSNNNFQKILIKLPLVSIKRIKLEKRKLKKNK